MILDFILAIYGGVITHSFLAFIVLMVLGLLFMRRDRPFSSGLLRFVLILLALGGLSSLFGGGDGDFDC